MLELIGPGARAAGIADLLVACHDLEHVVRKLAARVPQIDLEGQGVAARLGLDNGGLFAGATSLTSGICSSFRMNSAPRMAARYGGSSGRRAAHRLLAVGLCDLPHELGPRHVHGTV